MCFWTVTCNCRSAWDCFQSYLPTKDGAQVIALFSAGAYFLLKVFQGFFVIDLSIELDVKRIAVTDSQNDYLVATARLKRGSQGTFRVRQAIAILRQDGKQTTCKKLGFERYQTKKARNYEIVLDRLAEEVPDLNLAPSDATTLSAWWKVDRLEPCVVEVVIVGTKFGSWKRAQWHASATSVPEPVKDDKGFVAQQPMPLHEPH